MSEPALDQLYAVWQAAATVGVPECYTGSGLLCRESNLNVTLTPEQYAAVQEAAAEEEVKVATYCREAILARAMPEPELPDVATLPAWLLDFLLFVTRGKARPV